ncbi:MAG: DUF1223 domain-containing protein [Alphaproteobacteria bacterium]
MPPKKVDSSPLNREIPDSPVVVELFSSQACLFCPKADEYLNRLSKKENVIALACHVDYYDVREGSLAQPFCTQRQNQYSHSLRSGPRYTPQMILNGRYDVIGHKTAQVDKAFSDAARNGLQKIRIQKLDDNTFRLSMPQIDKGQYAIWVALILKPAEREIQQGKNRGQNITYQNIVNSLASPMIWSGDPDELDLSAELDDSHEKIVVMAQNQIDGHIMAAGQYRAP